MIVGTDDVGQQRHASDRVNSATLLPAIHVEWVSSVLTASGLLLAVLALADLAVRAAVRLETRWDTFAYHIPFAAVRGGLHIPYDMNDVMRDRYEGFPALPDLLQGILWRLTGSINATGVVNYLAFIAFLAYCQMVLQARFWLVALIALTAPLVVIHTTVSYVDLFGNSLLAIGLCSCLGLYLFPDRRSRRVMLGACAGLIGAAWSKFNLVPIVALGFCLLAPLTLGRRRTGTLTRRQGVGWFVAAVAVAALPYLKNLAVYGNPFWPFRMPVMDTWFPYTLDAVAENVALQTPPPLQGYSRGLLFVHSLLEINHPTSYPDRPRWIIDQGDAMIAFRMGGFWVVGVVTYLATTMIMLIVVKRRVGVAVSTVMAGILCFVAFLPQSHELRYYMFIPLCWAAAIGMLFPQFKERAPLPALAFLVAVLGLFSYMLYENRVHYLISKTDYTAAAQGWGATPWWDKFQRGQTYCTVDMMPIGFLLTGPTMSEYSIVDRSSEAFCPDGTMLVTIDGLQHVVHHAGSAK